jgi:hypothetical protein
VQSGVVVPGRGHAALSGQPVVNLSFMEMEESWAHLARLRNSGPARSQRRHPHRLLPRTLHSDQVDSADLGQSTNE